MTAIAKNRDGPRVQSPSHRVVIFDDSLWDVTFDRADESTVSAYYLILAECFKSVPLGSVLQKKKRGEYSSNTMRKWSISYLELNIWEKFNS